MFKLFGSKKHPKGPDWSKAKEHCLDFSGTKVFFSTPPHSDPDDSFKKKPISYNIYDDKNFHSSSNEKAKIQSLNGGYEESWRYTGFPLFGEIGSLKLGIGITCYTDFHSLYNHDCFLEAVNYGLNCNFGPISNPESLAEALNARTGIVEHGLFLGLATDLIVANTEGVYHRTRNKRC